MPATTDPDVLLLALLHRLESGDPDSLEADLHRILDHATEHGTGEDDDVEEAVDTAAFSQVNAVQGGRRQEEDLSESADHIPEEKEDDSGLLADDPRAYAEMIADILYGLYGEDALADFMADSSDDDLEEAEIPVEEAWNALHHPRGKNGRFIPKGSGEARAAASEVISKVLRGEHDGKADAESVAQHLSILTVKQIKDLHREHGQKPPRELREGLVNAVLSRLPVSEKEKEKPQEVEVEDVGGSHPDVTPDVGGGGADTGEVAPGTGGGISAGSQTDFATATPDEIDAHMDSLHGREYGMALKSMPPDVASEYLERDRKKRQFKHRSDAAKKGVRTKDKKASDKAEKESTDVGKRLSDAQARVKHLGDRFSVGGNVTDEMFDRAERELQNASLAYNLMQTHKKPDVVAQRRDSELPEMNLDAGADPVSATRAMNTIPWTVRVFPEDEPRIISGAKLEDGLNASSWNANAQRVLVLYGIEPGTMSGDSQTHSKGNELGTFRVTFPAGDPEQSRRARRLVREIATGKAQNMTVDELQELITGKPVPPEVLADYPDLAAKYGQAPTPDVSVEAPGGADAGRAGAATGDVVGAGGDSGPQPHAEITPAQFSGSLADRMKQGKEEERQAHELGKSVASAWTQSASPAERQAVTWYRDGGYKYVNKQLRDGSPVDSDRAGQLKSHGVAFDNSELISHMDSILDKGKTTSPVVTFRGLSPNQGKRLLGMHPGSEFVESGYSSTTLSPTYAYTGFGKDSGVVARVRVPEGAPSAYLSAEDGVESELLLARGAKYRVANVTKATGPDGRKYSVVNLDLVGSRDTASPADPKFTGTDPLGRKWVNGELVARQEEPAGAGGEAVRAPTLDVPTAPANSSQNNPATVVDKPTGDATIAADRPEGVAGGGEGVKTMATNDKTTVENPESLVSHLRAFGWYAPKMRMADTPEKKAEIQKRIAAARDAMNASMVSLSDPAAVSARQDLIRHANARIEELDKDLAFRQGQVERYGSQTDKTHLERVQEELDRFVRGTDAIARVADEGWWKRLPSILKGTSPGHVIVALSGKKGFLKDSDMPATTAEPANTSGGESATSAPASASEPSAPSTPALPVLSAVSDKQRQYAETVRGQQVARINAKLANLDASSEAAIKAGRADRFAQQRADLRKWLERLATVKDARRILDTKDIDFTSVTPNTADIVAKKLGVTL